MAFALLIYFSVAIACVLSILETSFGPTGNFEWSLWSEVGPLGWSVLNYGLSGVCYVRNVWRKTTFRTYWLAYEIVRSTYALQPVDISRWNLFASVFGFVDLPC